VSSTRRLKRVTSDGTDRDREVVGRDTAGSCDAAVARAFLERARRTECPRDGCAGRIVMEDREVVRSLGRGGGASVVLRCTARPEVHTHTIRIRPYGPEEQAVLVEVLRAGRRPRCRRCGSELDLLTVDVPGGATGASVYSCGWCGVRWSPRGDIRGLMR
jgi:hypothetical protein